MRFKDIDDSAFETWKDEIENKSCANIKRIKYSKYQLFFFSTAWKTIRKDILDHYGRCCMKCKTKVAPIQVDHIKPRYIYPELALSFDNLQVLCRSCNFDKGLKEIDYRPCKR